MAVQQIMMLSLLGSLLVIEARPSYLILHTIRILLLILAFYKVGVCVWKWPYLWQVFGTRQSPPLSFQFTENSVDRSIALEINCFPR